MTTMFEKCLTNNWIICTEESDQIPLSTTEIRGPLKYSMVITNTFWTDTENQTNPTIKPTMVQFNQRMGKNMLIVTTSPSGV